MDFSRAGLKAGFLRGLNNLAIVMGLAGVNFVIEKLGKMPVDNDEITLTLFVGIGIFIAKFIKEWLSTKEVK